MERGALTVTGNGARPRRWRWRRAATVAGSAWLTAGTALAAPPAVLTIPSCYSANPGLGLAARAPERELFVAVDQTVVFDATLRQAIRAAVMPLLTPGTAVFLVRFSAFSEGRYTTIGAAGTIEAPPTDDQRFHANGRALATFDQCLRGQLAFARRGIAQALDRSFEDSSPALAHSDVIAALRDLSARVRTSTARDRIVLVASDMLENSALTSFYAYRGLRRIDPARELRAVSAARMLGDFGRARVYVVGAGLLPPGEGGSAAYRDPASVEALHRFWAGWFAGSGAQLAAFGTPLLLRPVR